MRLLKGEKLLSDMDLENIDGALKYRLGTTTARASDYKTRLGIDSPDCSACDIRDWTARFSKDKKGYSRYGQIYDIILSKILFDIPADHEGHIFEKSWQLL